ncbi:MAG: MBOAT family protein [Chitinophagales bacterium]|nr:MBOAT family protein [Chitinophagales bacterium]
MLFNSFSFVGLVLITMLIYYIPKLSKYQVNILIISSLIFYSWNNIALVTLLLFSAGINILSSYYIFSEKTKNKKLVAWIGVSSNLLILAFYKYAGLISFTFFKDTDLSDFLITIPLPIGISFFTFQGISLVVDVYKGINSNEDKIISESLYQHAKNTLFFISFFPQLVAGPIVKAHEFYPQIKEKKFSAINWEKSFKEIVLGYFLKVVVADNLKDFTFWIEYPYFQNQDSYSLIMMLFGYSCQIYADFAGYSLIAIGIARLFGYNLSDNFNFPYISTSFKEFWKRWHISLSSFLQEYLYIPLGGNKKGKARTYINLMMTMILGGLWHGASWSYAVWGAFHGLVLAIERFFMKEEQIERSFIVTGIRMLFVFFMVSLAWLLFKLPEFSHVVDYIKCIFTNTYKSPNIQLISNIFIFSLPVILHHLFYLYTFYFNSRLIKKYQFVFYGMLLFLIITNAGVPGSFIYFQF